MKTLAIFGTKIRTEQISYIQTLLAALEKHNFKVFIYDTFHKELAKKGFTPSFATYSNVEEIKSVNFLLSCGGDGTFLSAANFLEKHSIPILGINLGRLGFLASIPHDELESSILKLANNTYTIEKRSLIELDVNNNPFDNKKMGLNEIAIHKKNTLSFLSIEAYINNKLLSTFWADGLIIATPTGSTAYSLSIGGPILSPDSQNFVITPIAPHTLTVRPIVVPDNSILKFKVCCREKEFNISIDSNCKTFPSNTTFTIKKSEHHLSYVEIEEHTFYEKLRNKLMWGSDIRN